MNYLLCPTCDAPSSETPGLCVHCQKSEMVEGLGKATTWLCAKCGCCCSYSSYSEADTCMDCTKQDLADIFEEDSGDSELIRRVAKQESRLAFLQLQFFTEQEYGGLKGDVIIVVQGRQEERLYAHKFILSSKCPVFCKRFDTRMREKGTDVIWIDDATLPVIRAMIKFCYSAEIDFSHEVSPEEVLKVAHKYAIDFLQEICEDCLILTINKCNLPRRLDLAMELNKTKLRTAATKYLKSILTTSFWKCWRNFVLIDVVWNSLKIDVGDLSLPAGFQLFERQAGKDSS